MVLTLQRRTVLKVAPKDLEDTEKISISNIFFEDRFTFFGPLLVFFVHLAALLLILFGINQIIAVVNYAGNLVTIAQKANAISPTFFNLLNNIFSPNPAILGITNAVKALYYLLVIIFPILHLIMLAFLWFAPLPFTFQSTVFTITEIFSAWSTLEVFAISTSVLISQLTVVAGLVVGTAGQACSSLANLNPGAMPLPCLTTAPAADAGLSLSIIGGVVYVLAANGILRIANRVIQFRIRGGVETERRRIVPNEDSIGSDRDYVSAPEESYESAQSYSFGTSRTNKSIRR
jgi:hypothetical protein